MHGKCPPADPMLLSSLLCGEQAASLQKLLAMQGFNKAATDMKAEYTAALSEMKATEPRSPIVKPDRMFGHGRRNGVPLSYLRGLELLNEGS